MGRLTYIGHSTFEIILDNTTIYIDPYFSSWGGRKIAPAMAPAEIKEADLILLTHEHEDHCDRAAIKEIVERTGASVVGPREALATLAISDRNKVDVRVGDSFNLKGVDIEVTSAVHPQSYYPVGYIIRKGGVSIYHAGDTYEFTKMMGITADYSLLPIGGAYTMDPIAALKAAKEIRTKHVIPMHYNTWDKISQVAKDFARQLQGSKVKPIVLNPGESIEV